MHGGLMQFTDVQTIRRHFKPSLVTTPHIAQWWFRYYRSALTFAKRNGGDGAVFARATRLWRQRVRELTVS